MKSLILIILLYLCLLLTKSNQSKNKLQEESFRKCEYTDNCVYRYETNKQIDPYNGNQLIYLARLNCQSSGRFNSSMGLNNLLDLCGTGTNTMKISFEKHSTLDSKMSYIFKIFNHGLFETVDVDLVELRAINVQLNFTKTILS